MRKEKRKERVVRIRYYLVFSGVKLLMHTGFSVLSTPKRQISSYLPAFGSIVKTILTRILVDSLSHLTHFIAPFARRSHFHFVGNLIIGFAMGGAESKSVDITIDIFR